jgi:hypothetical protein
MSAMTPASAPSDPWYWSGTFWAIAGVVATLLGIIIGGWITARVTNPRRRLYVFASNITPLMHRTGVELGLEVRAGGQRLIDPHVVTANVVSRGRRDIRKDAFDGPIQLQFSARIVGVLETSCSTKVPGTPVPPYSFQGDRIEIPPALLRLDHELSYTVLVEGETPSFSAIVPVEADIRLQEAPAVIDFGKEFGKAAAVMPVLGLGGVLASSLLRLFTSKRSR